MLVGTVVWSARGAGFNPGITTAQPHTKQHTSHGLLRCWGLLHRLSSVRCMPKALVRMRGEEMKSYYEPARRSLSPIGSSKTDAAAATLVSNSAQVQGQVRFWERGTL